MFWLVMSAICGVTTGANGYLSMRGGPRAAIHRRVAVFGVGWTLLTLARWAAHSPV